MEAALISPQGSSPLLDAKQEETRYIQIKVLYLIVISTIVRLFMDYQLELGNDEVYYWTYALYPDWSHFDHPPFVGILTQLFTFNLFFKSTFFLRVGSIITTCFSTWLIYRIGTKVKNPLTGLYAAFLFTSSIYCSIISGFALTPDATLVFFWLLSLNTIIDVLSKKEIDKVAQIKMMLFGVFTGLALISKYQSAFLWVGILSYIIIYNRRWLKDYSLYVALLLSLAILMPIIIWNFQNHFISFTFHSERVTPSWRLRPDYFLMEIAGQILYNNPLNAFLLIVALVALIRGKVFLSTDYKRILLLAGVPVWALFTGFSLFRPTLPHWSGPAFLSFIVLTAAYWAEKDFCPESSLKKLCNPLKITIPVYFLTAVFFILVYLVNYSPLQLGKRAKESMGQFDFTQDMYGWDSIEKAFGKISAREEADGKMQKNSGLVSFKWFPGSHIDYYVAWPHHRNLFLLGPMNDIHRYAWINKLRGGMVKGKDYYHIAVSNYYRDPNDAFGKYFEKIEPIDTVAITRSNKVMRYAFFYRLKNYQGNFVNPLPN